MTLVQIQTHSTRTGQRALELESGWVDGGLAVTASVGRDGWTVTHVASGYGVVFGIGSPAEAERIAKKLLDVGDWTRGRAEITADEQLCLAAKSMRRNVERHERGCNP